MFHDSIVLLYAITVGFTTSGIAASVYGLICGNKKDKFGRTVYLGSMVIAGPLVLFERAAQARRDKSWPGVAVFLATLVVGYWSFAIGLFVLDIALTLAKAR